MLRTKSGLPKHCGWNLDRANGKRRVRFRKGSFSTYLTGIPWSEEFMRQYAAALEGVQAQAQNIGASRTIAGTVSALVAAYLDPQSKSSPFKTGAPETQRTRGSQLGSRHTIAAIGRRRPLGHAAHGSDHERRGT